MSEPTIAPLEAWIAHRGPARALDACAARTAYTTKRVRPTPVGLRAGVLGKGGKAQLCAWAGRYAFGTILLREDVLEKLLRELLFEGSKWEGLLPEPGPLHQPRLVGVDYGHAEQAQEEA